MASKGEDGLGDSRAIGVEKVSRPGPGHPPGCPLETKRLVPQDSWGIVACPTRGDSHEKSRDEPHMGAEAHVALQNSGLPKHLSPFGKCDGKFCIILTGPKGAQMRLISECVCEGVSG